MGISAWTTNTEVMLPISCIESAYSEIHNAYQDGRIRISNYSKECREELSSITDLAAFFKFHLYQFTVNDNHWIITKCDIDRMNDEFLDIFAVLAPYITTGSSIQVDDEVGGHLLMEFIDKSVDISEWTDFEKSLNLHSDEEIRDMGSVKSIFDNSFKEYRTNKDHGFISINPNAPKIKLFNDFIWHCTIGIKMDSINEKGMPTSDEQKVLNYLENKFTQTIARDGMGIIFGVDIDSGWYTLLYQIDDPDSFIDFSNGLTSINNPLRTFRTEMDEDGRWENPRHYLRYTKT